MKTVLATILIAFVTVGCVSPAFATESSQDPAETAAPESDPTTPQAAQTGQDDEGGTAEDQPASDPDLMKKFTRHRPGACPEGPPCKVED